MSTRGGGGGESTLDGALDDDVRFAIVYIYELITLQPFLCLRSETQTELRGAERDTLRMK